MIEVVVCDEFTVWYGGLDDATSDDVERAVGWLEEAGLRIPLSERIWKEYLHETVQEVQ